MKKVFLIAVLVISANIAFAQDKYEFMTINYETHKKTLCTSIDGTLLSNEKVDLGKDEAIDFNINPLLKKLKEYQDKGWEVVTFTPFSYVASYPSYMAFLRKKKN
jgi:hypothetical protein